MKRVLIAAIVLLLPIHVIAAGSGNQLGAGYLAKTDETKVYSSSTGEETDQVVAKNFPLLAWDGSSVFFTYRTMSSENISDGRLHVRYYKNGKDDSDGQNTAWLNPKDVIKITFDCCGDQRCPGIESHGFASFAYSECFNQSIQTALEKLSPQNPQQIGASAEIEKLKLQLEIEKMKLEMEKLKSAAKH